MVVRHVTEGSAGRSRALRPADVLRAQQTQRYLSSASRSPDPRVRTRLLHKAVLVNLPVADRLALRYSGRGIATQDLVQVARLGLVQAAHRFDPDAGFDFLSYAAPTILGELKRHFRDQGWTVRPPRRVQELQPKILAADSALAQTLGRAPTRTEIAHYLSTDAALITQALSADGCFAPTSLDRPVVGWPNSGSAWGDSMGYEDPALAWVETKIALAPLFRGLGERDRHILRMRFLNDMTQGEIGDVVGLSQMHVSRILARIAGLAKDELAA